MDLEVVWCWEVAEVFYVYTQLYLMPLVMMMMFSLVTYFRREMSCNHVYALEDGTRPQQQRQQIPKGTSLLAPLLWLRFDRGDDSWGYNPSTDTAGGHNATDTDAGRHVHQRAQGEWKVPREGLSRLYWPEAAQQALDGIMARLPIQAFERLSEASLRIIPRPRKSERPTPLHPDRFPSDVQVKILSFLQPRDVVTFAITSRVCRDIVDGDSPTTKAVWKTLWQRDYGWIIHSWKIGRQAFLRSNVGDHEPHGKEFYFRFGLSYVNYLLAGLNTHDRCFVGLHGNIYDITDFVFRHPGSPETLFVHAGRDATKLFDDMDHSRGARRLAKEFCIAVDMSYSGSCGLKPTIEFDADRLVPAIVEAMPVIGKKERRLRPPECLKKIYEDFYQELHEKQKETSQEMKDDKQVLHWTQYYDPFQRAWKSWYTSRDFETVFK